MRYSDYLRYDPNTGNLYWLKDYGVVKAARKGAEVRYNFHKNHGAINEA